MTEGSKGLVGHGDLGPGSTVRPSRVGPRLASLDIGHINTGARVRETTMSDDTQHVPVVWGLGLLLLLGAAVLLMDSFPRETRPGAKWLETLLLLVGSGLFLNTSGKADHSS